MMRATWPASRQPRRRLLAPSIAVVLLLGIPLSACGDDEGRDGPAGDPAASAATSVSTPDPAAQFWLPRDSRNVSARRRAEARAADAGREACEGRPARRVLSASIVAAKRQTSRRGAQERRLLIAAAERLPAAARGKPAGASLAAALYSLGLSRDDRLPGRAGCLSALLESGGHR